MCQEKTSHFPVIIAVFSVKLWKGFLSLAVDAAIDTAALVHQLEFVGQLLLCGGNTPGVGAEQTGILNGRNFFHLLALFCLFQQLQDQRHTHILGIQSLAEISGTGSASTFTLISFTRGSGCSTRIVDLPIAIFSGVRI